MRGWQIPAPQSAKVKSSIMLKIGGSSWLKDVLTARGAFGSSLIAPGSTKSPWVEKKMVPLIRKSFKGRTKAICKERKDAWLAEQAVLKEKSEAQAQLAARELAEEVRRGHSLESEAQFEAAFLEWLKLYKSPPTRKPSTYAS